MRTSVNARSPGAQSLPGLLYGCRPDKAFMPPSGNLQTTQ
ncbi:hypothetical protein CIT292_11187 [Citrobacter youngae ATCC 29220]|uniref:Lipoprotein n=1 Tax=Citrobacter youngae ATCC 29220 TaxID=500640 RepID=D4BKV7_9ENTR|nr:hypothetical protein CIT292_11187 [Citrobacter youngae ATCC 29220]